MNLSPLSTISPELRNQIYELVLVHEHPVSITADKSSSNIRTTSFLPDSHALGLLRTCTQINSESTALFYGNNSFHFEFPAHTSDEDKDELCLVQRFCANLGKNALVGLRDLHIHASREGLTHYYSRITYACYPPSHRQTWHSVETFSRHLLGLRGIAVLNEELKVNYTIAARQGNRLREGEIGEQVLASLQVDDLETALGATIAALDATSESGRRDLNTFLCDELKRLQKAIGERQNARE